SRWPCASSTTSACSSRQAWHGRSSIRQSSPTSTSITRPGTPGAGNKRTKGRPRAALPFFERFRPVTPEKTMTSELRTEEDSLGTVELPAGCLWGIHTQRAIGNFPISGIEVAHFPEFVRALAWVKKAAARANLALGVLDHAKAGVIG